MAYATIQDFKDRIDQTIVLQLTTRDGVNADDAVVQRALDDASATIDGYLERLEPDNRPSAAVLLPYCVDIAVYRLARNRPGQSFESIESAFKAAVKYLSDLAQRRYPVTATTAGTGGATFSSAPRVFSRGSLGDF